MAYHEWKKKILLYLYCIDYQSRTVNRQYGKYELQVDDDLNC